MKCSRTGVTLASWCVTLAAIWLALPVHAQDQFVLADVEYTATAQNTSDSHYPVTPKSGIPTNWRSPVDYASGTVYVELEILEKPSDKNTFYNICIENASNAACLPYIKYTSTGKYRANFPFGSQIWQYDKVDWTMGCTKVSLILKDDTETKQQGNADFYPYKAHVVLTIVKPGATYVPPSSSGAAAGSGGSGGSGGKASGGSGGSTMAGMAGKGGSSAPASGGAGKDGSGGSSASTAGKGGSSASASGGGGKAGSAGPSKASDAGTTATSSGGSAGKGGSSAGGSSAAAKGGSEAAAGALANQVDKDQSVSSQLESTSGCSTTGQGSAGAGWLLLGLAFLMRRKRA